MKSFQLFYFNISDKYLLLAEFSRQYYTPKQKINNYFTTSQLYQRNMT